MKKVGEQSLKNLLGIFLEFTGRGTDNEEGIVAVKIFSSQTGAITT
jgi:hypothetical protein